MHCPSTIDEASFSVMKLPCRRRGELDAAPSSPVSPAVYCYTFLAFCVPDSKHKCLTSCARYAQPIGTTFCSSPFDFNENPRGNAI